MRSGWRTVQESESWLGGWWERDNRGAKQRSDLMDVRRLRVWAQASAESLDLWSTFHPPLRRWNSVRTAPPADGNCDHATGLADWKRFSLPPPLIWLPLQSGSFHFSSPVSGMTSRDPTAPAVFPDEPPVRPSGDFGTRLTKGNPSLQSLPSFSPFVHFPLRRCQERSSRFP